MPAKTKAAKAATSNNELLKFLPEPGKDETYDKRLEAALEAIRATKTVFDEDDVRIAIGRWVANERGVLFEEAFIPAPPPEPEKPVVIDLTNLEKVVADEESDYFYEPEEVTQMFDLWIQLAMRGKAAGMLAIGPSGCGKTEGYTRGFAKHDIPVLVQHVSTITDPEKWLGHKEIGIDGTTFVLSDLMNHIQKPGATIFDELNRAHPSILNIIMSLLDGQRRIQVPELQGERGEPFYVYVNPSHMFVATANIGTGYGGTYTMDVALLERFPYRLPRDFPPAEEEQKVLMRRTGVELKDAERMVYIANRSRQMWRDDKIDRPISTRTLIHWAVLVSAGMPIPRAAEFSVLGAYRDESVDGDDMLAVKALIEGKGGSK